MLHAGVLMKLGHFSIIRVAFEILPDTTREMMPIAAVLCIFSIMYGGFVAFYAKDTKYVIGYSSSSHMGYVFLGMAALRSRGLLPSLMSVMATTAFAPAVGWLMAGIADVICLTRNAPGRFAASEAAMGSPSRE